MTAAALEDLYKPKFIEGGEIPRGMVARNRKLADRLEKKKKDQSEALAAVDPKKKGGVQPPAPVKPKEEVKKPADIVVPKGKTKEQVLAEMAAEEEQKRLQIEEIERLRREELESNFDQKGELKRLGGNVMDFFVGDGKSFLPFNPCLDIKRSQHYEWLLPIYYKNPEREDTEIKTVFLEARTVTVKRTLVPNIEELEFGEIPVAFRKVSTINLTHYRLKKF